jgi:hypothetical protein
VKKRRSRLADALPIARWLPTYRAEWLRFDLLAGVTLAAFAVPESIAYASLAGVPSQAGLYCYLLAGIAYFLFGASRQMAVGPTSALALLTAASLGAIVAGDPVRHASLGTALALLIAVVAVLAWVLRLGFVVNFISETTLAGFKRRVPPCSSLRPSLRSFSASIRRGRASSSGSGSREASRGDRARGAGHRRGRAPRALRRRAAPARPADPLVVVAASRRHCRHAA